MNRLEKICHVAASGAAILGIVGAAAAYLTTGKNDYAFYTMATSLGLAAVVESIPTVVRYRGRQRIITIPRHKHKNKKYGK